MNIDAAPPLPAPLAAPLGLLPEAIHSRLLAASLNQVLATPLEAGVLDFLLGRVVLIEVSDARVCWRLTCQDRRLHAAAAGRPADLLIRARLYDFMLLVARQVDPDTLVFQRRMRMQGDTDLGLHVKNCLDGLDTATLPLYDPLISILEKSLPWYTRLCDLAGADVPERAA